MIKQNEHRKAAFETNFKIEEQGARPTDVRN